jgi:pimeloyl-ACP methyl ester carboxylesterase
MRLEGFEPPTNGLEGRGSVGAEGGPAARVLQASRFRKDVTAFRLNARPRPKTGSEPAFRRNEAEHVCTIEAAHTRRSQVQILPPLFRKARICGPFSSANRYEPATFGPLARTSAPRLHLVRPAPSGRRTLVDVTDADLRTNPDALPDAEPPRIGRHGINGTSLYAEVRGSGPAVLLIHAGAEDAEGWRPIAERLTGFTVVTYDRRGTLRSGRDNWPGGGSAQHADDAAGLLEALGLDDVLVLGYSSSGNIALHVALRHPQLVRRALVYEPGYLLLLPDPEETHRRISEAAAEHLVANPDDWAEAYAAVLGALAPPSAASVDVSATSPQSTSWYDEREGANAEALFRDDIPILTAELLDEAEMAAATVEIRFSFGTETRPIFRDIADHLAAIRGTTPDVLEGVGHFLYYHPDAVASYVRAQSGEEALDAPE